MDAVDTKIPNIQSSLVKEFEESTSVTLSLKVLQRQTNEITLKKLKASYTSKYFKEYHARQKSLVRFYYRQDNFLRFVIGNYRFPSSFLIS